MAWFGTLSVYYSHIILLLFTLVFGSPVLIRYHVGQMINLMLAFVLHWSLGTYFEYECIISGGESVTTMVTSSITHYKNSVPFPAVDVQMLYFSFVFLISSYYRSEWQLNTDNKHVYYRFLFLTGLTLTIITVSYLWFYSFWQLLISVAIGSSMASVWHRITRRFLRYYIPTFTLQQQQQQGEERYSPHHLQHHEELKQINIIANTKEEEETERDESKNQ